MNTGSLCKVPQRQEKTCPLEQLVPSFGFGVKVSHQQQLPGGEEAAPPPTHPTGASLAPGSFPLWPENIYFL